MRLFSFVTLIAFGAALPNLAFAQYVTKAGYINNVDGEKCWFHQKVSTEKYLQSLPADTTTLVFDNPKCMSAKGIAYDVNIMMINNRIAYPYSHPDAAFQTRVSELRNTSFLQIRGKCIQSATYPIIGVVADYVMRNKFIISVKHAIAVNGCQ